METQKLLHEPQATFGTQNDSSRELKMFTEHEIREALSEYVNSNCCYKSEAAEKMAIQNIVMTNSYTYTSEAVIETRLASWKNVPYVMNMKIDGPENGPSLSIWDVWTQPPEGFKFKKTKVCYEMPHTASTARCSKCLQAGNIRCRSCNNTGVNSCTWCNGMGSTQIGNGRMEAQICTSCNGRGMSPCPHCKGSGLVQCPDCAGSGFIKTFQEIQIGWEVSSQSNIIKNESCKVPDCKLKKVTGETSVHLMNGCDPNDNPLRGFPDARVRAASSKTFEKYNGMLSANNKRVLNIRQTLATVLVAEVTALWKGKTLLFFVFGNERKVFFLNGYPQSCCICT